jgi:hypothetical protein
MYTTLSVHKKHNTRRVGDPLLEHLALSGRGYAAFHDAVNFALTEF